MRQEFLSELRQQLQDIIPTLLQGAQEVAALFQQGDTGRGFTGLQEVLEALQSFHVGLDILESEGRLETSGFASLKAELENAYPNIFAALKVGDTVTLADVLKYEVAASLSRYEAG